MGFLWRRVTGYVVFALVSVVLSAIALQQGYLAGGTALAALCGAAIFALAFLASLLVTRTMKRRSKRKARRA